MTENTAVEAEESLDSLAVQLLPEGSNNYELDTSFRCDTGSCGAQAYVRTTFRSGGQLFWCLHHANKSLKALTPYITEWYSEENRLKENRHRGSDNS